MTADDYWRALGLAAPARRALIGAGIADVRDLSRWNRSAVAALHGMGPNALARLDDALASASLSFTNNS